MLDNATYDMMETAAVLSKGLHRYGTFRTDAKQCESCGQLGEYMRKTDEERLQRLVAHLRSISQRLGERAS